MAREASLIINVQSNVDAARAAVEKFISDVESREIKLKYGSGSSAGNPATFSNTAGTPMPSASSASDRMEATNVARVGGASLIMENGQAGASRGGIAAVSRLDQTASPTDTVRFYHGGVPGDGPKWLTPNLDYAQGYASKSPGGVVQYLDIPKSSPFLTKSYDDTGTGQTAPYNNFEAPASLARGLRPFNESKQRLDETSTRTSQNVKTTSLPPQAAAEVFGGLGLSAADFTAAAGATAAAQRVTTTGGDIGRGTRYGRLQGRIANVREALAASSGADAIAYQSELDELLGDEAVMTGQASRPRIGSARGGTSLRRLVSRYAATGISLYGAGTALETLSSYLGAGAIETGSEASFRDRQRAEELNAISSGIRSIPIAGSIVMGASDAIARSLNNARGFGYVTRAERYQNAANRRDAEFATGLERDANDFGSRMFSNFDSISQIEENRKFEIGEVKKQLLNDRTYADDSGNLRAAGVNRLEEETRRINREAAQKSRDFGVSVATGYASAEIDRRMGEAGLARNAIAVLDASTYGRASAMSTTTDPQQRRLAEYQAGVAYNQGARQIQRDNYEASFDIGFATLSQQQALAGFSLQGAITGIEAGRARQLRDLGGTGSGWLDNALGYTARRAAINAQSDQQRAEAYTNEARADIAAAGAHSAARYLMSDRPLDAQIASIKSDAEAALTYTDASGNRQQYAANSPQGRRIRQQRDDAIGTLNYQHNNETKLIGISQRFQNESLDRQLALDPVGAQAADIAGQTEEEGNRFAMAGRPEEAERARALGKKRLDLLARNYSLSFRGEQIDLRAMRIDNPRDSQNPAEVFAQIQKQQDELDKASFGGSSAAGGATLTQDQLVQALKPILDVVTQAVGG